MYLFSGKIKCMQCGKFYRGKSDRSKKIYICQGYSNGTTDCSRFKIVEDDLMYTITKHFEILGKKIEKSLSEYVNEIHVKDGGYRIYYKGKSNPSIVEPNKLVF